MDKIFDDIKIERQRQKDKWGNQEHPLSTWMVILGEEFGEACKDAVEYEFNKKDVANLRKELVQTAAVAVAALEDIDRRYLQENRSFICRSKEQGKPGDF